MRQRATSQSHNNNDDDDNSKHFVRVHFLVCTDLIFVTTLGNVSVRAGFWSQTVQASASLPLPTCCVTHSQLAQPL